jgi:ribokinase
MHFLVYGSINIDQVFISTQPRLPNRAYRAQSFSEHPGGKGANQSVALSLASQSLHTVTHYTNIGLDGEFILDLMRIAGVNTDLVKISETEKTGRVIIALPPGYLSDNLL